MLALQHDNFADLRTSISIVVSNIICGTSFLSNVAYSGLYNSFELGPNRFITIYTPALSYILAIQSTTNSYSIHLVLDILSKLYNDIDVDYIQIPFLLSSLPSLLELLKNSDIKLVTEASNALKNISALRCTSLVYTNFLNIIKAQGVSNSKVQEMIKGLFLTLVWFFNQFITSPPTNYFFDVIFANSIEIRQTGRYYLSMI